MTADLKRKCAWVLFLPLPMEQVHEVLKDFLNRNGNLMDDLDWDDALEDYEVVKGKDLYSAIVDHNDARVDGDLEIMSFIGKTIKEDVYSLCPDSNEDAVFRKMIDGKINFSFFNPQSSYSYSEYLQCPISCLKTIESVQIPPSKKCVWAIFVPIPFAEIHSKLESFFINQGMSEDDFASMMNEHYELIKGNDEYSAIVNYDREQVDQDIAIIKFISEFVEKKQISSLHPKEEYDNERILYEDGDFHSGYSDPNFFYGLSHSLRCPVEALRIPDIEREVFGITFYPNLKKNELLNKFDPLWLNNPLFRAIETDTGVIVYVEGQVQRDLGYSKKRFPDQDVINILRYPKRNGWIFVKKRNKKKIGELRINVETSRDSDELDSLLGYSDPEDIINHMGIAGKLLGAEGC